MTLELTSLPLALLAGMLSILSPCVWPLVPVVMTSASAGGAAGPWFLGLGLSASFALAGTVLTFVLLNLGIDTEVLRYAAAVLLILVAGVLLRPALGEWVSLRLSRLTSRAGGGAMLSATAPAAQFGVGALLGLVWLPCVGPTLGAAIALASLGQSVTTAFVVMLVFALGTVSMLLFAGTTSKRLLARWRPGLLDKAGRAKKVLAWTLLLLAVLVLSGGDKVLEAYAVPLLPAWAVKI